MEKYELQNWEEITAPLGDIEFRRTGSLEGLNFVDISDNATGLLQTSKYEM